MSKNKTAQILAAVMCASSVIGSYTAVVSADPQEIDISNGIEISAGGQKALSAYHAGNFIQIDGAAGGKPIRIYDDGGVSIDNVSIGNGSFRIVNDSTKEVFNINENTGTLNTKGSIIAGMDITSTSKDGKTYSLNAIGEKTQGINTYGGGRTSFKGDVLSYDSSKKGYYSLNQTGAKVVGISRDAENEITTIEGNKLSRLGIESRGDVKTSNGYSLDAIGNNTQAIKYVNIAGKDFTTFDSGIKVANDNGEYVFSVDQNGTVISKDDIKASGYSVKTIGANTQAINYVNIDGKDFTTFDSGIKVANDKGEYVFSVDQNGTVISKDDIKATTTDGNVYSLKTIGDNTANITRDGVTTNINGELSVSDGNIITNKDVYTTNTDGTMRYSLNQVGAKTAGIEHDAMTNTTTVEGVSFNDGKVDGVDISKLNTSVTGNGADIIALKQKTTAMSYDDETRVTSFTGDVTSKDGETVYSLNKIGANTQAMSYSDGTTSFNGNISATGDVTSTSENGKVYSLNTVGANLEELSTDVGTVSGNVAGIKRDSDNPDAAYGEGTTSIEDVASFSKNNASIKIGNSTFDMNTSGTVLGFGANSISLDRYGTKFINETTGDYTWINGGNIIATTLNGHNIDEYFNSIDGNLNGLTNKINDIYNRTQGIGYDEETGTTTIDGDLVVKGDTTSAEGGSITSSSVSTGNIEADKGTIGGVTMENGQITTGNTTINGTGVTTDKVTVGQTSVTNDGVTVGNKETGYTSITNNDVVINNNDGSQTSLANVGNRVTGLESSMNSMNNRINDVEDRIDKVGAMAAAIANLRTMGFDPEAPTEIAVGIGQYKSETGLALGVFHYPNQDFMLSASISTSGDEVMGGIGATWKLGRKSAAEKAKDEEAKHLKKAEEMKKIAQEEKVKAQAERHAKLLAEREAQKEA